MKNIPLWIIGGIIVYFVFYLPSKNGTQFINTQSMLNTTTIESTPKQYSSTTADDEKLNKPSIIKYAIYIFVGFILIFVIIFLSMFRKNKSIEKIWKWWYKKFDKKVRK